MIKDRFWYSYTIIFNSPKEWDGRSRYSISLTPSFESDINKFDLNEDLQNEISDKFERLRITLHEDLIQLDNERKENRFVMLINKRLSKASDNAANFNTPKPFETVIKTQFHKCLLDFQKEFISEKDNKKSRINYGIQFLNMESPSGWSSFNEFCKALRKSSLIPSETNKMDLKIVFSKGIISKKIIWLGSHPEADHFFKGLKEKKHLIKINPIWLSVNQNFAILDKEGIPMPSDKLNSLGVLDKKILSDKDSMREINSIIDLLETEK
ncbi:hypothetical protein [Gillisia hiemivivida]|uniref:DUF3037 domain-containing protein n=1 Tax=Gillisia hiemivivida TaxID=291190 RepID=A0A5C6ZZQ3_9FLAO|nr:hypothetical protein [Gillisia hiemivivida]TXD95676.1 hypothetical protein ES724_01190 [Gillisia hiemivivida]